MTELDDEALIAKLHEAASLLSYYNAGEGDCYARERQKRGEAHDAFYALRKIAMDRGVFTPEAFGRYLV